MVHTVRVAPHLLKARGHDPTRARGVSQSTELPSRGIGLWRHRGLIRRGSSVINRISAPGSIVGRALGAPLVLFPRGNWTDVADAAMRALLWSVNRYPAPTSPGHMPCVAGAPYRTHRPTGIGIRMPGRTRGRLDDNPSACGRHNIPDEVIRKLVSPRPGHSRLTLIPTRLSATRTAREHSYPISLICSLGFHVYLYVLVRALALWTVSSPRRSVRHDVGRGRGPVGCAVACFPR